MNRAHQLSYPITAAAVLSLAGGASGAAGFPDPAEIAAFTDAHFESAMAASGFPGAVVAVVHDGETVLLEGYGTADVGTGAPIDPERTLFRLGSITKPMTAIAVLRLAERGVLDLDADVGSYLKGIRIPETFDEPVTLGHLLSHTGGFDADLSFSNLPPGSSYRMTAPEIERRLRRMRPPGRVASYDVLGFGLAGIVLREVTGKPFREVIREEVFEPAGMSRSVVGTPPDDAGEPVELAACHVSTRPGDVWVCGHPVLAELFEGSGGAAAPAADVAKLMKVLLREGGTEDGPPLLSPSSFADLTDFDHYRFHPFGPGIGRSLQERDLAGRRAIGHGGGISGFNNDLVLFPAAGVGLYMGVLGGAEQVYDARLSSIPALLPDASVPREAAAAIAKLWSFPRLFAERFLPPEEGWPRREMTESERSALAPADRTAALAGLYAGSRFVSSNVMMRVARHTLTKRVESAGDGALRVDGSGPYLRIAPLYYEDPETGRGVAFRVTDARTFLSFGANPLGTYEKVAWYADPRVSLLPLVPALLLVLSSAVYLLPRFAGGRRRLGAFGLTGGVLFLAGLLLETELATYLVEVRGATVVPFLWRLGLVLGLLIFAVTPLVWAGALRQGVFGAGKGRWVAAVHGASIGVAGLYLVLFAAYWIVS
jgi:CubicO group peptidase (beta-lactamase class C family)